MKPFTLARRCCCVRKKLRERLPSWVVVTAITTAIATLTSVSGMLSTIIEVNVATMVIIDEKTCASAVEIIWRSESTSLVYTLMMSPCERWSKYWMGRCCIFSKMIFRRRSIVPWLMWIIRRL